MSNEQAAAIRESVARIQKQVAAIDWAALAESIGHTNQALADAAVAVKARPGGTEP